MKRPYSLGDLVRFKTTTGRFETELTLIAEAELAESSPARGSRYESALAAPIFASPGADD
jgi:hypothetical protein